MQRYTENDLNELYDIIDSEYNLLYRNKILSSNEDLNLISFSSVYRSLSIYRLDTNSNNNINFNLYKNRPIFNFSHDFWRFCSPYNSLFTILPYIKTQFHPFSSYNYNKFNNSTQGTRKFMLKHNCILVVYLTQEYINSTYHYFINIFINRQKLKELILRPDYKMEVIIDIAKTQKLNDLETNLDTYISDLLKTKELTNYSSNLDYERSLPFSLYDYQKKNINWMKHIESDNSNLEYEVYQTHSLFSDNTEYDVYKRTIFNKKELSNIIIEKRTLRFNGGVLMDEMGLGKTITCLSYLYLQKSKNNTQKLNTEFCNYKYKRGNFANTFCSHKTINNTLFCKTHQKTFPNVLRYNKNEQDLVLNIQSNTNCLKTNASLIICPSHLCDQWMQEVISKFKGRLNAIMISTIDHLYNIDISDIVNADVIILSNNFFRNTSYTKFCDKKKNISVLTYINDVNGIDNILPLHYFMWKRIILDEGHETLSDEFIFKQLHKFNSEFKWILSGTPFANGIMDLYKMIFYLTFNDINNRTTTRTIPYNLITVDYSYDTLNNYGLKSHLFLNSIKRYFRRNLKSNIEDQIPKNIINEHIRFLTFTQNERNIYESYINSQESSNHNSVTTFLLQLCCDPELYEETRELVQNCKSLHEVQSIILKYNEEKLSENTFQLKGYQLELEKINTEIKSTTESEKEYIKQLKHNAIIQKRNIERIQKLIDSYQRTYNYLLSTMIDIQTSITDNKKYNCPICLEDIENENLGITQCGHKFCWDCIKELFENNSIDNKLKCPTCCLVLKPNEVFKLKLDNAESKTFSELDGYIQDVKSTKIGNIIYFLKNQLTATDKCIIFSQWDGLLRKVKSKIDQFGIKSVNCIGTVYQKRKAISQFTKDSSTQLIFLSSQNSASGLNLMCANKIIFIEPIYGSETYKRDTENQAIGRADRIGQNAAIDIYRFIIKDTIEENILPKV